MSHTLEIEDPKRPYVFTNGRASTFVIADHPSLPDAAEYRTGTKLWLLMITLEAPTMSCLGPRSCCLRSLWSAVAIAIDQVLFVNQLSHNPSGVVPGPSGKNINSTGLMQIIASLPPVEPTAAMIAFDCSIIQTGYLVVGLACATLGESLLIEWGNASPAYQAVRPLTNLYFGGTTLGWVTHYVGMGYISMKHKSYAMAIMNLQ
ncbi:uncharacterized protein BO97DRAFT_422010 [Aspergillus homomorphus CBS 101889]|uniref:Uncharacterized protein n=1 Tax=Aspergillus homomorphus (strain CBS 101889) TaxID=1450537 RepID=A0A395I4U6_ASPHC|nr:hypothetical protein BO97DRAFT_422010 [Aspergillus homomorphus CBS 101889]RAL15221.1 hypothetical protein BO97DRAFT_422010 [Aspergillus homomorphus CBS 101889]